jgi:hypothetical protein
MIYSLPYFDVITDLKTSVDPDNNMGLIISYTYYSDSIRKLTNTSDIKISFSADTKYNKLISVYLIEDNTVVIDEPFDDYFFYASEIENVVDKICWFSIPAGYNDLEGLNNLNIYSKVGV